MGRTSAHPYYGTTMTKTLKAIFFAHKLGRELSTESPHIWIPICYVRHFLNILSVTGNLYNMLLVTIDRYIYMTRPLKYEQLFTPSNGRIAICIIWVFVLAQALAFLIFWTSTTCLRVTELFVLLPLQVMIISTFLILPTYVRIGFVARKLNKTEPHLSHFPPEAQAAQKKKLRERKMAKTLGLVLGVYLGSWASAVSGMLITTQYKSPYPYSIQIVHRILSIAYWMQTVVNPFLYGWRNQTFAKYYRKILRMKPSQVDVM